MKLGLRLDIGMLIAFGILIWACLHKFGWTDGGGIIAAVYLLTPWPRGES